MRHSPLPAGLLACAVILVSCATPRALAPEAPSQQAQAPLAPLPSPVVTTESNPPSQVMEAVIESAASGLSQAERFEAWKFDFITRASAKGRYTPELLAETVGRAQINEKALERDTSQPEFTRPVWSYIKSAASADRINRGKDKLAEQSGTFDSIEATYGVPRHILTAIWGLESSYGRILGTHDIIDSLATFAFEGRRTSFGEAQLYAVLDLLSSGDVRADQLTGSWAGAMGMTQFIPTTFRDYAIDFDRDGNKNLWESEADALASAAHYLSRSGWRKGEPVMAEVLLPEDFDYSLSETVSKTVNDWTALGVRPANGMRWNGTAGLLDAKLLAPAGHRGPKLLVFKNFDVIKRYNNSTSYVMGIASLGDALRGRAAIRSPWPESDEPLSFIDKQRMQEKLTELGYSTGGVDGQIGPMTRKAIRAWQRANGLPADGYVEQRIYERILASG